MDNKAITALAREYAEIACPEFKYKGDKEWRKDDIKIETLSNEAFLTWLLRRFCLVEKSKLEQMYKEAVAGKCELEKMRPQNTYAKNSILMKVGINAGCACTLKFLFPEIAKEVEG